MLSEHAKQANLDPTVNKWDLIFDFSTTAHNDNDDNDNKKRNYEFLDPAEFKLIEKELEGYDKPQVVFPYPERYGGTMAENERPKEQPNDDGMMAFGINVS